MKKHCNGGPCVFDEAFKQIARADGSVELSHSKGSVQEVARKLGIDSIATANRPDQQMAAVGRCRKTTKVLANLELWPPG